MAERRSDSGTFVWVAMIIGALLVLVAVTWAIVCAPHYLVTKYSLGADQLDELTTPELAALIASTRQAVGIAAASLLAALVAATGVLVNRRTVSVMRDGQAKETERHEAAMKLNQDRFDHDRDVAVSNDRAKRYHEAVNLIGTEGATTRLAGVYALAQLADEWPSQRRACVAVLCAHMRANSDGAGAGVIGHAILSVIAERVARDCDPEVAWTRLDIDLDGAMLPEFSFKDCAFSRLSIRGVILKDRFTLEAEIGESLDAREISVQSSTVYLKTSGAGVINVADADVVGGKLTVAHSPEGVSDPGRRYHVMSKGVRVRSGGEYKIVLNSAYPRFRFLATAITIQEGLLVVEGARGANIEGSPIDLDRLRLNNDGQLQVSRGVHHAAIRREVSPTTDQCDHRLRGVCDAPDCTWVYCRCLVPAGSQPS